MRLRARPPLVVLLWFIAEVAAFSLIARAAGFGGALFLCLLTSLLGIAMLRRLGLSTAWRLRRAMAARSHVEAPRDALVDGGLAAIGSILLILPGFVSDLCGFALASPSFRAWLVETFQNGRISRGYGRRSGPALVELDPQEWSRTDHAEAAPAGPGPTKFGPTKSPS